MLSLEHTVIEQGAFTLRADLSVSPGRKVAVIGPSGAGKSTLLGAIAGFVPITSGKLVWSGMDMTRNPPGARPIAMLFQDNNLFPHLTVAQNVGLGLRPALRLNRSDSDRVREALGRVGLGEMQDRRPAELSGGQQSRAALARILVQDKPLVLLDEPFAALGPALRFEMLDLLGQLLDDTKATLMIVTHAPEDARRVADDLIFVADHRAQPPVPAAEALDHPPPDLRAYLG